jgi:nitronate monooxygenase
LDPDDGVDGALTGTSGIEAVTTDARHDPAAADLAFQWECHPPAKPDPARERAWIEYLSPLFAEFGVATPTSLREIYSSFVADDAMLGLLLEQKPAVVSFHFGLPAVAWVQELAGSNSEP